MKAMDANRRPRWTSDPAAYSEKCRRKQQTKFRRVGAFVQRLVLGAVVSITTAVLLAVMIGVWG